MCELFPPGIVYCCVMNCIFLQQQQHHPQHHIALVNSYVIMATVDQIASGVMVWMTAETTVMKKDVVQVCTCIIYSVY